MPHISVIIQRAPHADTAAEDSATSAVEARVVYTPPDAASEQEVAQEMRRLYRQVRNLGTDNS